jgi:hypothetical protein
MTTHPNFWEAPLETLDRAQWEALCDGCGKCCLHKVEDDDTGRIYPTNVACKLLDLKSAGARLPAAYARADWRLSLAAFDLCLCAARRGQAAARLALSHQRQPRDRA